MENINFIRSLFTTIVKGISYVLLEDKMKEGARRECDFRVKSPIMGMYFKNCY